MAPMMGLAEALPFGREAFYVRLRIQFQFCANGSSAIKGLAGGERREPGGKLQEVTEMLSIRQSSKSVPHLWLRRGKWPSTWPSK